MYYSHIHYPAFQHMPIPPIHHPLPYRIQYPPVNIALFSSSVQTFQTLLGQGSILLDRLGNPVFAHKIMESAQQGKQIEVDQLIQAIGLKVTVKTNFTPTGIIFTLQPPVHDSARECCTLTISLRWGN
jgi:hypothetical protein